MVKYVERPSGQAGTMPLLDASLTETIIHSKSDSANMIRGIRHCASWAFMMKQQRSPWPGPFIWCVPCSIDPPSYSERCQGTRDVGPSPRCLRSRVDIRWSSTTQPVHRWDPTARHSSLLLAHLMSARLLEGTICLTPQYYSQEEGRLQYDRWGSLTPG